MGLLSYLRILERGYYDIIRAIRIYSSSGYEKSLMNIGRENIPTRISREEFNSDNCLRRVQPEKGNKKSRVYQRQKALLIRINKDIKGLDVKIEEDMQKAFSRDIKSRRWCKRHHFDYKLLGKELFH